MQHNKRLSQPGIWLVFFVFVPHQFEDKMPQNAEDLSLLYVLQTRMALDGSGFVSELVQFNIAKCVNCAARLFAELDGFF